MEYGNTAFMFMGLSLWGHPILSAFCAFSLGMLAYTLFLSALGCARRLFLFSNNPKVTFPLLSSRFLLLPFGCIAKIKCNIKAPQCRSQAYHCRTYRADYNTQNHQMKLILFPFSSKYKFFPFFGTPKFLMEPCFFPGIPAAVKNHKAYILSI